MSLAVAAAALDRALKDTNNLSSSRFPPQLPVRSLPSPTATSSSSKGSCQPISGHRQPYEVCQSSVKNMSLTLTPKHSFENRKAGDISGRKVESMRSSLFRGEKYFTSNTKGPYHNERENNFCNQNSFSRYDAKRCPSLIQEERKLLINNIKNDSYRSSKNARSSDTLHRNNRGYPISGPVVIPRRDIFHSIPNFPFRNFVSKRPIIASYGKCNYFADKPLYERSNLNEPYEEDSNCGSSFQPMFCIDRNKESRSRFIRRSKIHTNSEIDSKSIDRNPENLSRNNDIYQSTSANEDLSVRKPFDVYRSKEEIQQGRHVRSKSQAVETSNSANKVSFHISSEVRPTSRSVACKLSEIPKTLGVAEKDSCKKIETGYRKNQLCEANFSIDDIKNISSELASETICEKSNLNLDGISQIKDETPMLAEAPCSNKLDDLVRVANTPEIKAKCEKDCKLDINTMHIDRNITPCDILNVNYTDQVLDMVSDRISNPDVESSSASKLAKHQVKLRVSETWKTNYKQDESILGEGLFDKNQHTAQIPFYSDLDRVYEDNRSSCSEERKDCSNYNCLPNTSGIKESTTKNNEEPLPSSSPNISCSNKVCTGEQLDFESVKYKNNLSIDFLSLETTNDKIGKGSATISEQNYELSERKSHELFDANINSPHHNEFSSQFCGSDGNFFSSSPKMTTSRESFTESFIGYECNRPRSLKCGMFFSDGSSISSQEGCIPTSRISELRNLSFQSTSSNNANDGVLTSMNNYIPASMKENESKSSLKSYSDLTISRKNTIQHSTSDSEQSKTDLESSASQENLSSDQNDNQENIGDLQASCITAANVAGSREHVERDDQYPIMSCSSDSVKCNSSDVLEVTISNSFECFSEINVDSDNAEMSRKYSLAIRSNDTISQKRYFDEVSIEDEKEQEQMEGDPFHPLDPSKYKTELCRAFQIRGSCRYGIRCNYAHGLDQLKVSFHHGKYKTRNCQAYHETGYCRYGARCSFIHDLEEGILKCSIANKEILEALHHWPEHEAVPSATVTWKVFNRSHGQPNLDDTLVEFTAIPSIKPADLGPDCEIGEQSVSQIYTLDTGRYTMQATYMTTRQASFNRYTIDNHINRNEETDYIKRRPGKFSGLIIRDLDQNCEDRVTEEVKKKDEPVENLQISDTEGSRRELVQSDSTIKTSVRDLMSLIKTVEPCVAGKKKKSLRKSNVNLRSFDERMVTRIGMTSKSPLAMRTTPVDSAGSLRTGSMTGSRFSESSSRLASSRSCQVDGNWHQTKQVPIKKKCFSFHNKGFCLFGPDCQFLHDD